MMMEGEVQFLSPTLDMSDRQCSFSFSLLTPRYEDILLSLWNIFKDCYYCKKQTHISLNPLRSICIGIDPKKDTWRVKVRVLRVWDMFPVGEPSKPYAIHVVLIDVEGVKIEGIIKKAFLPNCLRSGVAILIVTMHQYTLRSSKSKQQIFARVFHPEEVTMKFVFYVWSEMKILDTDHIFFFLCLFLWNIQVYIFVPRQFLNDFEESLSKYVELVDPVGNKFCVSFYFDRDEPRFGANISELRTVHQIQGSVIICFIYLGDSRFDIQISDLNLFEIEYRKRTAHVAANVASSSHLNFHEVDGSVINLISDDDSENEVEDIVN
ncbi:uncharacterized protein LOC130737715 isoform X3 [Lotus japonicus]|uniref:uncharacterized protein LOC130737715 isoform X3 n=1 Tax=Lotus japonicus TaxID=34305 RepID=UPI002589275B|nr:uncharacterized protein LOC130737715 isoform X3 [Lotus japonicus]